MKPLLKWVGGKSQILEEVITKFPNSMENYYEPFLGGGSVLLGLLESEKKICGEIFASDVNPHLIRFYTDVKSRPIELCDEIESLVEAYKTSEDQEHFYYELRSTFNSHPNSSRFFVLNKTCFRGLYREGPSGFNVPFGHYKNPTILDKQLLFDVSSAIQRVQFECCSFDNIFPRCKEGDFIYLDPPYLPEKLTSFVGYTAKGFDAQMHERLFGLIKKLPCRFLLSNASVPLIFTEFGDYAIQQLECRRSIHSRNPETKTTEVLVSNS